MTMIITIDGALFVCSFVRSFVRPMYFHHGNAVFMVIDAGSVAISFR
jgi:hypothetical protein